MGLVGNGWFTWFWTWSCIFSNINIGSDINNTMKQYHTYNWNNLLIHFPQALYRYILLARIAAALSLFQRSQTFEGLRKTVASRFINRPTNRPNSRKNIYMCVWLLLFFASHSFRLLFLCCRIAVPIMQSTKTLGAHIFWPASQELYGAKHIHAYKKAGSKAKIFRVIYLFHNSEHCPWFYAKELWLKQIKKKRIKWRKKKKKKWSWWWWLRMGKSKTKNPYSAQLIRFQQATRN